MEKASKNKKRFNVVDALIIMLVLALLITVGYRVYRQITDNDNIEKCEYVIEFLSDEEYYNSMTDVLKEGDEVYFCSDGVFMGYLYDSKTDSYGVIYDAESGEAESAETNIYEKKCFGGLIALSTDANEVKGSDYLVIGGRNISVGSRIEVYTEKATFTIMVISIGKLK